MLHPKTKLKVRENSSSIGSEKGQGNISRVSRGMGGAATEGPSRVRLWKIWRSNGGWGRDIKLQRGGGGNSVMSGDIRKKRLTKRARPFRQSRRTPGFFLFRATSEGQIMEECKLGDCIR